MTTPPVEAASAPDSSASGGNVASVSVVDAAAGATVADSTTADAAASAGGAEEAAACQAGNASPRASASLAPTVVLSEALEEEAAVGGKVCSGGAKQQPGA